MISSKETGIHGGEVGRKESDVFTLAMALTVKAAVLAARWAGRIRRRACEALATGTDERDQEILLLRGRVRELESRIAILRGQLRKRGGRPKYSLRERLAVIWALEYFQIPRRKVTENFGVARSSLYRWLRRIENRATKAIEPVNKTSREIADLVWDVAVANVAWGRTRISGQLRALKVFIAASTVRRILGRPRIRRGSPHGGSSSQSSDGVPFRQIPASYPNHVWSVDRTIVRRWGLWPTYILVAIDHLSRKIVAAMALQGPNAAWTCDALETAFRRFGPPKHIITDHEPVFTGEAFRELIEDWNVKLRYGAIGMHGSIAVTERAIKTMKHEWLKRVPLIRGFRHLSELCESFVDWYNVWRPHSLLEGACPDQWYRRDVPEIVDRESKVVPSDIERRVFSETGIVGFKLREAA